MTNYKKNYIGKGTQVPNMQIVKVTVKVAELLKFVHTYEDEGYVTFEVAKMQNPDKFGRDHTVYCTTRELVEETAPPKNSPKKAKATK